MFPLKKTECFFLALFRNKITIILMGVSGGGGGGHVFRFEGSWLQLSNVNILHIKTEQNFLAAMFSVHPQQNVTKPLIKIVNSLHMV